MNMILRNRFFVMLPMLLLSYGAHSSDLPSYGGMQVSVLSYLFLAAWTIVSKDLGCLALSQDVERHLEQGKKLLAAGQFADALLHYHMAIEGDPTNYMSYFRRATVYLAMGKSKSAIPDLDKVLELKPDFNAARMQRANVRLKQGRLDEAEKDYVVVMQQDSSNSEAQQHLKVIPEVREYLDHAEVLRSRNDHMHAIQHLTAALESCVWDANLHELRASSYEQVGNIQGAIQDIRRATKLTFDNAVGFLKLSTLLYQVGDAEESLKEIRECLKLDADHKGCHDHYKKVKKLVKIMQETDQAIERHDWTACLEGAGRMLKVESKVEPLNLKARSHYCRCHVEAKNVQSALDSCSEVLSSYPDDIDALCNRGEAHILNEAFEEAVNDFKKAESINGELHRVREGLQKAQRLLKQSQKRDYYKILGIKRTASKGEITKAYRKLAAQYHPDQYQGDDKEFAQKTFIDIAAAKEVLTDPEKRAKFDQGEDPLDPEQQANGGPQWHQGFNPFGQGGFQFKFHFN